MHRAAKACVTALILAALGTVAGAHGIGGSDATFVAGQKGPALAPFVYLGAKHMLTGYDHLLFLLGVVFWLHRVRDVAVYVTLFAVGHSLTLIIGTAWDLRVNEYLVDALIGFSVVWKAFDNLGGSKLLFGVQPDNRLPVFGFGLIHGLGLATKLQTLELNPEGLMTNLLAFNVGVELGQVLALLCVFSVLALWRLSGRFDINRSTKFRVGVNAGMMVCGFVLIALHLTYFFLQRG